MKKLNSNFFKKRKKKHTKNSFSNRLFSGFLIFFIIVFLYSVLVDKQSKIDEVPVSNIATSVSNGEIKSLTIRGANVFVKYNDNTEKQTKREEGVSFIQSLLNYGVKQDTLKSIQIKVEDPRGVGFWFLNIAPFLFPILFLIILIWFLIRQVKGAGMQAMSFGQSKAKIIFPNDKKQRITFKDVAGVKEAKEELKEIVDFLKNPKKFLEIGAQIPKGVILMGAPGTGKTLLARAVAGEANVAFFSISGSEFVEMFVGVGASRVRDLFKMAKKASPAIVFVDEIDAVGRVRGGGVGGGNDEREQTLNQILVEMDGFEQTEKVIVMAATNRPDVLDPALLRPGRFDRRVMIDLPDRNDREEILKIHSTKKPFSEDVTLRVIAERTPGFSGADLYSLMNEGAILAARENRKKVSQYDLIRSIEKVLLGPERRSHLLSEKEKELTAYHEAGHALVASVLPKADPVHKISIISRGRAGGYTLKLPIEERKLQSKEEFLADIAVSLGGYVAEKMIYGDITTGPSNDLQVSTALARDMVTKYGMSDKVGPIAFENSSGRLLVGAPGFEDHGYSEEISAVIDSEVSKIIESSKKVAEDVLLKHKKALESITKKLIEDEVIEREEFDKLLVLNGIELKLKLGYKKTT